MLSPNSYWILKVLLFWILSLQQGAEQSFCLIMH